MTGGAKCALLCMWAWDSTLWGPQVLRLAGERGRGGGGVLQVTEAAVVAGVDDAPRLDHHLLVAGGGRPQRSVVKGAGRGVAIGA